MNIGLIAGGFKPFTKGHFFLVEQAARDCDKVFLFVSTGDRVRKGEMPLLWKDMQKVWSSFLLKIMPSNVEVSFTSNPTTAIFEKIDELQNEENAHFVIFGDDKDAPKTYSQKTLEKYFPELVTNQQIKVQSFSRSNNVNISGTQMRGFLASNNKESFIENLPLPVQKHGLKIFNILKPKEKVLEMKKITKSQLDEMVRSILKEQLDERSATQATQKYCFSVIEEMKECLRKGDWEQCKRLCQILAERLEMA